MSDVVVRPMREADVPAADRIFRLAFGTFLEMPDPMAFAGDSDWVGTRRRADPSAAFVAERDGVVLGSNLATHWGSVGLFGPLSVHPELWDQGVARRLLEPVMDRFAAWGTTHAGLFTFAESPKHVALYGKYGFHPRFLTAVMAKPVASEGATGWTTYATLPDAERQPCLDACRSLTGSLFDGLEVTGEIAAVAAGGLGDTVLLGNAGRIDGLAVCHVGVGTESASGACYVKFAAVRSGPEAPNDFDHLLDACEAFAATRSAKALTAGTNLAREGAYRHMTARGFRTFIQGVAMHRPNDPAYSRPDVWAIDDWR